MDAVIPTFTRADDWEDIGHGVRIRRVFSDGEPYAVDWEHPGCTRPDFIPVGLPGTFNANHHWTLHKTDPLYLSPSLLCRVCGLHGFIQEGRWVPC